MNEIGINPTEISNIEVWLLYLIVLSSHAPAFFIFCKNLWFFRFPLIVSFYIGMFVLQGLGSIFVFISPELATGYNLKITSFAQILVFQALGFYVFLLYSKPFFKNELKNLGKTISCNKFVFNTFVAILFLICAAILLAFRVFVSEFAVESLISGDLNNITASEIREKSSYGSGVYPILRIAVFVFPAIIITLCTYRLHENIESRLPIILVFLICLLIPLLNAEKSASAYLALVGIFAYLYCYSFENNPNWTAIFKRAALYTAIAFVPVLVMYFIYYQQDISLGEILLIIVFRVAGAYSQSTAAAITYIQDYGLLWGTTFPTVHGLFDHQRVSVENLMHLYITGYKGAIPVSAVSEGFLNFGLTGYIAFYLLIVLLVSIIQIALGRIKNFGSFIQPFYAFLVFMLWASGLFQTIVSLVTTVAILIMWLILRVVLSFGKSWSN